MADALRRDPDLQPSHPGELLAGIAIPATGRPEAEIARLLGVSRQTLHDILADRQPVTPEMAVRFGKLFGNGARPWLTMQASHDLWRAERFVDVSAIPTRSETWRHPSTPAWAHA